MKNIMISALLVVLQVTLSLSSYGTVKSTSQGVLRSLDSGKEKTSHQVWRCVGKENVLKRIRDEAHAVWRDREKGEIDVQLSPLQQVKLMRFLDSRTCVTEIENLDRAVSEDASREMRFKERTTLDFFDRYHSVEEIHNWMNEIQRQNPKKMRLIESEHTSVEGRKILAAKICASEDASSCESMGKIYIQGLLHAREWIGGAAVLFVISEMMKLSPNSPLLNFEVVAVPVVNPDGYEFTRLKSDGNRMWRKNRRKNLGGTYGVDLNRNFPVPHSWGDDESTEGNIMTGASDKESSDVFRGPKSFSEPESRAVRDFILALGPPEKRLLGIDVHSYGQSVLRPYGYQDPNDGMPEDENEQKRLGDAAAEVMSEYKSQHAGEGGFVGAGGCDDWMHDFGSMYSFTIELRPDGPDPGFLLPEHEIRPTGEELFSALEAMASVLNSFSDMKSSEKSQKYGNDHIAIEMGVVE